MNVTTEVVAWLRTSKKKLALSKMNAIVSMSIVPGIHNRASFLMGTGVIGAWRPGHTENRTYLEVPVNSLAHAADNPPLISLLRKPVVLGLTGLGHTALNARVADGLFPRPVKLGVNRTAWPSNEVSTVIHAHIQGKTEQEIADLVRALHERRNSQGPITGQHAA